MISSKEFDLLYSSHDIQKMVKRMGDEITAAYPNHEEHLVCVGVLKGAWMLLADLVRVIKRPLTVDFIRAVSYGAGTQSSGTVRILKDIESDIKGKHVLLVEEMIDTGRTLSFIKSRLANSDAKSVKIAALLDKKERREVPCEADFLGAACPDFFVVGYGLDWAENYRELPDILTVPSKFTGKK